MSKESTQCISSLLEFGTACTESEKTNMRRDTTRKANQAAVDAAKAKFEAEAAILQSLLEAANTTDIQSAPLQAYYEDLLKQQRALEEENYTLQQQIRAGRRRFMDNEPQEGVLGIPGLQTTDDRIMLVFWVFFGFFLAVAIYMCLAIYGEAMGFTAINQKITAALVVFLIAYLIAYYFIYNFA